MSCDVPISTLNVQEPVSNYESSIEASIEDPSFTELQHEVFGDDSFDLGKRKSHSLPGNGENRKQNKKKMKTKAKQCGQEYIKSNGVVVPAKRVKPNPCTGKKCGNNCERISEERRKQIFDHFWKLPPGRRKDWIVNMTQKLHVKRKRSLDSEKRQVTFKYFINEGEGRRSICLKFLTETLDVTQKFVYYTLSNATFGSAKEDLRGKKTPPNKTKDSTRLAVLNFIKALPALPSRYSQKGSTRLYLPQEFKNIRNLYQLYLKRCTEEGTEIVGERVFRNIFNHDFDIRFHVPRKGKCLKCLRFKRTDTTDETIKLADLEHTTTISSSYTRFKADDNIHMTDPATLCVRFELQKVLDTPNGESLDLLYSRRLFVYNLTFYESGSEDVFCFLWDEVNGKRGANEIASILHRYITMVDNRESVKHLLLYCDNCPVKNRNQTILAMVYATLQNCKFLETIQINFLLKGHTYMPVDSVHAVIEKNLNRSTIWAPSQWYAIFETARQDPRPYNVQCLTCKDFNKWDIIGDKCFKGNLTEIINKMHFCTFQKKDPYKILFKNSMNDEAENFEIEVQREADTTLSNCYETLLPISKQKHDDLNNLCLNNVIPALFHYEYTSIAIDSDIQDTLPDTDLEDEDFE